MKLMYPISWPAWRLFYRMGFGISFRVFVAKDVHTGSYSGFTPDFVGVWAKGDDLKKIIAAIEHQAQIMAAYMLVRPGHQLQSVSLSLVLKLRYVHHGVHNHHGFVA